MHRDVISLDDVWRLTSAGAALRWGFFDKGVLAVGADADIAVLEPKQETDLGELYTKCGWTPMVGKQLHGRVAVTIAGGTVAYDGEPDTRCRGRQVLREGAGEEND
ncbi:hypothetical protein COV94_04170 [Candidatus Woesearchaeota archaeon CG11_big_fil_rev_8_21_14_0_20_57_5]|nr:MAG: hypothetical protein COV94_04170 [Candidatus Woesearchaeota archaeon CG11_big_fil_rev_8_21_14_0_20_57_5]